MPYLRHLMETEMADKLTQIEGEIEAKAKGYILLLKAHEKLVILAVSAVLLWHIYGVGINAWVQHDQRQASLASQQVLLDAGKTQQLEQELQQLRQQVTEQNAQLNSGIQARQAATQAQRAADVQETPAERVTRLQDLLQVGKQDVQSSPIPGEVTFDAAAALKAQQQLEELASLKQDNIDLNTEVDNERHIVATQDEVIPALQKELADEKISHADDVKLAKAENKKQFLRGFKYGAIVGAIGGEIVRVFLTHKP